jgi:hypothetical protein
MLEKVAKSMFDLDTCMKLTRFVSCLKLASTCYELLDDTPRVAAGYFAKYIDYPP